MNPNLHRVILYAELNGGKDISEKELRLIVDDLEKRGFKGYYERIDEYSLFDKVKELFKLGQ